MPAPLAIQHDLAGSRFVIQLEGHEAFLQYRRAGREVDLYHTDVPDVLRGRGLAEQLCRAAFEYARAEHLIVIPTCSYIAGAYLKRHPEDVPLTKPGTGSAPSASA